MASLRDSPTPGSSVPGRAEPHYRSGSSGLRQLLLRWQPQSIPGDASLSLGPAGQPWSQVCSLMPRTGGFLSGSIGAIITPNTAIGSLLATEPRQPAQAQAWPAAITTLDKSCCMSSLGCPQLCHLPGGLRCPPLCQVTLAHDRACQRRAWHRQPHCSGCLAQRGAAPCYGVAPHPRGSWGLRTQWRAAGLTYCKTTPCRRAPAWLRATVGLHFSPAAWHAAQGQQTSPHARCCVTATGGIWI